MTNATSELPLEIYAVYRYPSDYPDKFVVRRWRVKPPHVATGEERIEYEKFPCAVVDTLQAARAAIPEGLAYLPRTPDEDPAILETWR